MDKGRKIALLILLVALVLLGLIYFFANGEQRYLWSETYIDDGDQPYDLSLFKGVLQESSNDFEVLEGLFADTGYLESSGNTMIYIGGYAWLDSTEATFLKRFVANGNNLIISSRTVGKTLRYLVDCDLEDGQKISGNTESLSIELKSEGEYFQLSFEEYNQPTSHSWIYFNDLVCAKETGFLKIKGVEHSNMIEHEIGNGKIVLHSTPLVFTNYHFRKDSVFNYVNGLISKVNGNTYYYLEPSTSPSQSEGPSIGESPLKFILAHESLKWAWYITIILALLYIINSMRRKQRAIPVILLPENQTSAYLDMVYRLFRKEGSHRDIIQSQVRLLQSFLRNRYNLNANKLNDDFYEVASAKLKLDKNYLEHFFKQLERSRYNSTLNDGELLKIDRQITEFYLRCP